MKEEIYDYWDSQYSRLMYLRSKIHESNEAENIYMEAQEEFIKCILEAVTQKTQNSL